jgi:hypothetical protein
MYRIALCLAAIVAITGAAGARPIDPSIDDGPGPFSYFSRPSTVLGMADGTEGTQVTPEGWLWTGSAQLMFFAGPKLEPLRQRIQTLRDGCIPIVTDRTKVGDVEYELTMFGWTLDSKPQSPLVNFIRARITNTGKRDAPARFATALRAEGDHCCSRLRVSWNPIAAKYAMGETYAARDGQLVYAFPAAPMLKRMIVPDREAKAEIAGREEFVVRDAPVCMAQYDTTLAAGQDITLDFVMPYKPAPLADEKTVTALQAARFDDYEKLAADWWQRYLAQGTQIDLPEAKAVDTWQASLMYDSVARSKWGDDYVPTVNYFQYHYFWVRDGAYIINAFDLAGRPRWAEQCLEYYMKSRQPDGIIYQPPQLDGWGQSLWAFGSHWRLTGDDDWARRVYPTLAQHVRAVFARTPKDPLGLVPPAPPYDNEAINGHYTGHSFWLLIGMQDMIGMAQALGHPDDAKQFTDWYNMYRANFERALSAATAKTGGYIPPGLDAENGCDWDNMIGLYPRGGVPARGALNPQDPRVAATVNTVRAKKYAEGIMTYGAGLKPGLLHLYDTIKNTEAEVAMNRQRDALADFYALLVHTSSTQAGFEFGVVPWDNRDTGGNFPPHGWFAAEYMGLLRNMLVREWDGDLRVFSVVSPEWMKPGKTISIRRAPTDFGEVSVTARFSDHSMSLRMTPRWRTEPRSVILHLPWFVDATGATADGKQVAIEAVPYGEGKQITLPASTRQVNVQWQTGTLPGISYAAAVDAWKAENCRRFAEFTRKGGKPEPLWTEGPPPMTRPERQERWAALEAQCGIAVGCKATASASEPGNPPEAAVDGSDARESYWGATPWPAWWQVDLGAKRKIEKVRVVTYWDDGANGRSYQYRLQVSPDGQTWQTVADESRNTDRATPAGKLHVFRPVSARYVRVEMLHNSANTGVHLVEVSVFPGVEAPIAEAPAQSQAAWTAEAQTGAKAEDFPGWGFVGAQRIVLSKAAIKQSGDRVRLAFRGGEKGGIAIGDVSIAATDPADAADTVARTRVPVTFGGVNSSELPPGGEALSDWISFPLQAGRDYTVTFNVLRTGATTLWSDAKTKRFESQADGAARAAGWSQLGAGETYNVYFLARVEVPR